MKQFARRSSMLWMTCLTILTSGAVPACVHTSHEHKDGEPVKNPTSSSSPPTHEHKQGAKGGSPDHKSMGPSAALKIHGQVGIDPKEGLPLDSQLSFFKRVSRAGSPFGESDRKYITEGLPKTPEVGSVAEAALVAGVVRSILTPLPGGNASTPPVPPSLEQLCAERQLNLSQALAENALLLRADVAAQVLKALQAAPVSAEFKSGVIGVIKKQANSWSEVNFSILALEPALPPAPSSSDPAVTTAGGTPSPAASNTDKNYESLLGEAQSLADKGDYRSAVKKAAEVPEAHPLKLKSQEKVREYSNQAVQDLRRKAALAFQSALPVADPKTKTGYLKQAKSYLEDALKNYPDATQLPTVQDNLRVISQDLEKLETSGKR